jgi:hypothetical protein
MRRLNKKAQSTSEYAIVIALVIGAVVAMQVYVKRGLNGGLKYVTDKLKAQSSDVVKDSTGQYEPYYTQQHSTIDRKNVESYEEFKASGEVARSMGQKGGGNTPELTQRAYQQGNRGIGAKD